MRDATLGKVVAAAAVVVLLVVIVLHFSGPKPDTTLTTATSVVNIQDSAPSEQVALRHGAATPKTEVQEPADLDEASLPKLPREKVEEYLARNHRSAASLLAAFDAMHDTNYLNEAAASFPNEPQVQWTVLERVAFPEDRRKWLDLFKASSPSNSLANYLSAADYLKKGQPDAAIKEFVEAAAKPQFKEYVMDASRLDEEELSRVAGSSDLISIYLAGYVGDNQIPQMATMKGLAGRLGELRKQYLDAGDLVSANHLAQMQYALATRLTTGESGKLLFNQLVGLAVEEVALHQLEPNNAYDFLGGKTPAERLGELKRQKQSSRELAGSLLAGFGDMTEVEIVAYHDRIKVYGEFEAMRWLQQRVGRNAPATGP